MKNTFVIFLIFILASCDKKAETTPQFECDIVEQPIPKGDSARLFMPNAFTPNGDGLNDRLAPIFLYIASIDFTIYNAANEVLFHSDALENGWWEAEPSNENVRHFYYKIQAITLAGNHIAKCGVVYAINCYPDNLPLPLDQIVFGDQYDLAVPDYLRPNSYEQLVKCN